VSTEFDFVVIGAGSAGCAVANRLSASGQHQVLLLEAGPERNLWSSVPISFAALIDNPSANWCYRSEPEAATAERRIPVPRGRMLGGSSSINGMVFVRGQQLDFDTWAQMGNRGWSFEDVLPYFKRMEAYGEGGAQRGTEGPLRVGVVHDDNPLYEALLEAGIELGLPRNADYNGNDQEGIVRTQATIAGGRRMSAAVAYLQPAKQRRNLVIRCNASVTKLTHDNGRCTGVEYSVGGRVQQANAAREVILCGGAINSPQLLELSGIGAPQLLEQQGIGVHHALPGVGENLRDHIGPRMAYRIAKPGLSLNDKGRGYGLLGQIMRYALKRDGLLSLPTAPVLGFIKTRPELASPDVQYHFVPYRVVLKDGKRSMGKDPGITITVNQCRPESVGSVHIRSSASTEAPAIKFNFLSAEIDRRTLIDGLRFVRRLAATQALEEVFAEEMQPGVEAQSDEALLGFIRDKAETVYHPSGTCKMGNDPMAVVDARLKVHGLDGLRIADASIMPTLTSGNTNAPCIMIGEKCADMVLADNR
jgi:choline dehydrogenase